MGQSPTGNSDLLKRRGQVLPSPKTSLTWEHVAQSGGHGGHGGPAALPAAAVAACRAGSGLELGPGRLVAQWKPRPEVDTGCASRPASRLSE